MKWSILKLDAKPSEEALKNVIVGVYWRLESSQKDLPASLEGFCKLPPADEEPTPYDELTEDKVLEWVWSYGINKDTAEAKVNELIESQKNPPIITLSVPWK